MDARISQQARQNAADQFRRWASARNVSLAQIEQMVTAVLSGQHDAKILQAMPSAQNVNPATQQPKVFIDSNPALAFQTPFGNVLFPSIAPMPISTAPQFCPPPATMLPDMFPTMNVQTTPQFPVNEVTRTIFPGGEALQQNSSYSGQQGNTTFQYNASSTSMTFTPGVQLPFQQPQSMPIQQIQQPTMPMMPPPVAQQQPTYIPQSNLHQTTMTQPAFAQPTIPQPTLNQPQQHFESFVQPQPDQAHVALNFKKPAPEMPAPPEPVFNPAAADQAPQNPRLASKLNQKLSEATYFSKVPGMPDRSVQR